MSEPQGGMSKTVAFLVFGIIAILGVLGTGFLLVHRPDATATFTTFVITILSVVSVGAGTFYSLGKVTEKVEQVRHQTNGTLSTLREELATVTAERDEYRVAEARRAERGDHRAE